MTIDPTSAPGPATGHEHDWRQPVPAAIEDGDWQRRCPCGAVEPERKWRPVATLHLPLGSLEVVAILDALTAAVPDQQLLARPDGDTMDVGYWLDVTP